MEESVTLLSDTDYVIRDHSRIEKATSVVLRGGLIVDVGKTEDLKKEYRFDEVYDCRGKVLLPGLINCHTHVHETMMRDLGHDLPFHNWCDMLVFPTAEAMEAEGEELYYNLAQLTAMEAVASGTTAFIEYSVNFAKRHSLTFAKTMSDMGFRGAVAKGAEDFSVLDRGHVGTLEREIRETREFLDSWRSSDPDGLVQAWVGPSGGKRTVGGCTNEGLGVGEGTWIRDHPVGLHDNGFPLKLGVIQELPQVT